jgi:ATP-dependent RNA helicase RhlE
VLNEFKEGKLVALVATDIAARGIDIDALPYVINFELPNVPEDYVHRIGRTGRAGMTGEAISLVCHDERAQLKDIEKLIKRSLERVVVEGFEQSAVAAPRPPAQERKPRSQGAGRAKGAPAGGQKKPAGAAQPKRRGGGNAGGNGGGNGGGQHRSGARHR